MTKNQPPQKKTSHSTASKELIKSLVTSFPSTPGPFSMFFSNHPISPSKLEGNFLGILEKSKDDTPEKLTWNLKKKGPLDSWKKTSTNYQVLGSSRSFVFGRVAILPSYITWGLGK